MERINTMVKSISKYCGVLIIAFIIIVSAGSRLINSYAFSRQKVIKAGVLLYRFDDAYISLVRESLEKVQNENPGKIQFTFYDGNNNQGVQNETLDKLLEKNENDILLVNLVETNSTREVVNKIKYSCNII
jgi:methyl-galactoside transport system substrate-binding protein